MSTNKLVFTGSGGQGVITAAVILGEAAVIHEGLYAVQTQSYGPEARGGATRSDLIVSDAPISYPKVTHPNFLVCLTQEAYNKYSNIIMPGGIIITDTKYVTINPNSDAIHKQLPLHDTVVEQLDNPIVVNVCMLGAVIKLNPVVSKESLMQAVIDRINPKFKELNMKAFDIGYNMVKI